MGNKAPTDSKAGRLVAHDARLALQSTASAASFSQTHRSLKPSAPRFGKPEPVDSA
jgi:hypothetical protein